MNGLSVAPDLVVSIAKMPIPATQGCSSVLVRRGDGAHCVTCRVAEGAARDHGPYTLDFFRDERAQDAERTGGKGSSLARLQAIPGIMVPEGFVVATAAYDAFLRQSPDLARRIDELDELSREWICLQLFRGDSMSRNGSPPQAAEDRFVARLRADLGKKAGEIRDAILALTIPAEVEKAVLADYARLASSFGRPDLSVAVRSSSVAEDTGEASFAGQHETFLNQVGQRQVLESLRHCWASTFGEKAVLYRNSVSQRLLSGPKLPRADDIRFPHRQARMAVVVQRMIPGVAAGVGFSVDPTTGRPDVILNLNHGLGQSIVQGDTGSPDRFVFRAPALDFRLALCGRKEWQVVPLAGRGGGVARAPVPEADRSRFALSLRRVAEIARAVQNIKRAYGHDVDTEFVLDRNGTLYFVQARPVTTGSPTVETVEGGQAGPPWFSGGDPGWPGVRSGRLRSVTISPNPSDAEIADVAAKVRRGDILVINKTVPALEPVLEEIQGMVVEEGGEASHAAIVAREKGLPAVLGAKGAVPALAAHDGAEATLDATAGRVYPGRAPAGAIVQMSQAEYDRRCYCDAAVEAKIQRVERDIGDPNDLSRLGRPATSMSVLQVDLYRLAFLDTLRLLGIDAEDQVFVEPCPGRPTRRIFETTKGSLTWKVFAALGRSSLEELKGLAHQRDRAVEGFQHAVDALAAGRGDVVETLDRYRRMIAFFHFRWIFARHAEWRFLQAQKRTPEPQRPYERDFRRFPRSEAPPAVQRSWRAQALDERLQKTDAFRQHLAGVKDHRDPGEALDRFAEALAHEAPPLVAQIEAFWREFPHRDDVDMTLPPAPFAQALRAWWECRSSAMADDTSWAESPLPAFPWGQLLGRLTAQSEREHLLQIQLQLVLRDHLLRLDAQWKQENRLRPDQTVFDLTVEQLRQTLTRPQGRVRVHSGTAGCGHRPALRRAVRRR